MKTTQTHQKTKRAPKTVKVSTLVKLTTLIVIVLAALFAAYSFGEHNNEMRHKAITAEAVQLTSKMSALKANQ